MPRRTSDPPHNPLSPLDYLLGIMNNPKVDAARRDKAAVAAAPYVHARADRVPKKARQAAEAKKAGAGTIWGDDLTPYEDGRPRQ